jgi:hypothetical protein
MLLVLALSSVAAGANENASPKRWVSTLCGSFLTWEQTLKQEFTSLKTTVTRLKQSGTVKPAVAKPKLVRFLSRIVGSTSTLIRNLRGVGPPAVANGTKLQTTLVAGLVQVNKAFQDAEKAAKSLPTGSRKAFAKAAGDLASTTAASVNRAGAALSGLNKYDTKALNEAFRRDKTCAKLAG